MTNQIGGILTMFFCSICWYASWSYQRKDNYGLAIILLMISGLALRIFTSLDFFLHPWDEVYHAVVAKHMMSHPFMPTLYETPVFPYSYQNWAGNHIWLHKQPLPLWVMAASMYLFGINEIALRLPSILLTTLGIWLTFYIGSYLFDKRTGYLAAFFYSLNGLIIEMSAGRVATDHVDVFFLFFIELAIFFAIVFCQKKQIIYNVLAGISIGAAILCKWLPALIVLPIWLLLATDSKSFSARSIFFHFVIMSGIAILTFLPWQLYIYHTFPTEANWEAGHNFKHITQILDKQGGPFYYYLDRIRINYGELIYLPLVWFLWCLIRKYKEFKILSVAVWAFVPILFFSLLQTKMQGYILFISPALFLITAHFWFRFYDYKKNVNLRWMIGLILILLIALPVRYTIERVKPFNNMERNPQWVCELKDLNNQKISKGVLLNYAKPIDAMFYTSLTAYSGIPDIASIQDLINGGYTVIVNDDGKIPPGILSVKGIIAHPFSTSDSDLAQIR